MLVPMLEKTEPSGSARSWRNVVRAESALFISAGTIAIFFGTGSRLVEIVAHPVALVGIFLWLFGIIVWSAISVVRHADCLATKFGEPYGTLILTLSAISIEVVMISTAMLHGANNPTLGRDAIFAVLRSEEHTSELQSPCNLVCRLLLEKKKNTVQLRLLFVAVSHLFPPALSPRSHVAMTFPTGYLCLYHRALARARSTLLDGA